MVIGKAFFSCFFMKNRYSYAVFKSLFMNLVLFGVYLLIILILFAFIAIVVMHIGNFKDYSKYLSIVLKIYLITIVVIAVFGAYKILSHYTPPKKSNTPIEKINF